MRSLKTYLSLIQILFFVLLFVFSSDIFAKRSGGRSGSRSFSSRKSSSGSGSSYSRSSGTSSSSRMVNGNRVYVSGGDVYYEDTNFLEDFLIYIIAGIIIFFLYFFRDVYTKKLSLYIIKISFKSGENEELVNKILKYNEKDLKIIEFEPQEMMKLVLNNKDNIKIDKIDVINDLKSSKARDLLRDTKIEEDKRYKELETVDTGEYTCISFIMDFKPEFAPVHDGSDFDLIKKLSVLEKDGVYYMEVSMAQNINN